MLKELFDVHSKLSTAKRIDGMSQSYSVFLAHYIGEYEEAFEDYNRITLTQYLVGKDLAASTKAVLATGMGKFLHWNSMITKDDLSILHKSFRMPIKNWSEQFIEPDKINSILTLARRTNTRLARYRDSTIIALLSTIGCRVGQLVALTSADFQVDSDEIATIKLVKQKERRRDIKENYDIKRLPLSISLGKWQIGDIIHQYLDYRSKSYDINDDTPLLLNPQGRGITTSYVQKMTKRIGDELSIKLTPHTFRHYVGHQVANAQGLDKAAALLGHSNIAHTMRYVNIQKIDTKDILICQHTTESNIHMLNLSK